MLSYIFNCNALYSKAMKKGLVFYYPPEIDFLRFMGRINDDLHKLNHGKE